MRTMVITDEVKQRITWLETERGHVTPTAIVEDAASSTSPLHPLFEWDDTIAAAKYRLYQARTVLQRLTITITTEHLTIDAPMYVRDPSLAFDQQGYVSVAQLRADPVQARASVLLEFGRAESALTRARAVAVALHLEDDIDDLVARLTGIRAQLRDEPTPSQEHVA